MVKGCEGVSCVDGGHLRMAMVDHARQEGDKGILRPWWLRCEKCVKASKVNGAAKGDAGDVVDAALMMMMML
jgi:hypothetical protein